MPLTREQEIRAEHTVLRVALSDLLSLCEKLGKFENGVVHNGIDEGEVYASGVLDQARAALASLAQTETPE